MSSLYNFLQKEESRLGAAEAGWLRSFLFFLLALWALMGETPAAWQGVFVLLPLVLAALNIVAERVLSSRGRYINPLAAIGFQLLLVGLWSFILQTHSGVSAALYFLVLYGSSLYLQMNLVFITALCGIILMNLEYLHSLAGGNTQTFTEAMAAMPANPLEWPGFSSQILFTLVMLFFAYAFPGRQRIIRRLISRQQSYFDMIRDQNSPLSGSLDSLIGQFGLSGREGEVLAVLILGKTYRMIAGELFISLDTVKSHVKSIYRKCGVGSREELIEVLRENSMVSRPVSERSE